MKFFNIALLFVILALACSFTLADDEGQSPAAKRIALRRPVGKAAKATTTTTTQAPQDFEEGDYQDENAENHYDEESDEGKVSSTTTTTTEAPKKVIGPVIRPFRSNDDFLNSLKRRQMNAKKHRSEKPTSKPIKHVPSEENGHEAEESAPAPAPVPAKKKISNSPYNRRKFTKPSKPESQDDDAAAEGSEQQQKEEFKPRRPIGRLALRKN